LGRGFLFQGINLLVDDVDHVRCDLLGERISLSQIKLELLGVLDFLHGVGLSFVDHLANLSEVLLDVLCNLLGSCLRLDRLHLFLDVVELGEVAVDTVADLAGLLGDEEGFFVVAFE